MDSSNIYDWWSRHPLALEVLYTLSFLGRENAIRRASIEALQPADGEWILEAGAGNGNSLAQLLATMDGAGTILAIDASGGMVRSASERINKRGWTGVHTVRGDALRPPLARESVDAAYAAMSLSAMADPAAAIDAVEAVVKPGGRFVVLDARPFRDEPWSHLNSVIEPIAHRTTNWKPDVDLVELLMATFDDVDVTTYNGGSIFVACASKKRDE